jgi:hypothetical protein
MRVFSILLWCVATILGCSTLSLESTPESTPGDGSRAAGQRRNEIDQQVVVDCGVVNLNTGGAIVCPAEAEASAKTAVTCFTQAFKRCERARIKLTIVADDSGATHELFVVPGADRCEVVAFASSFGWEATDEVSEAHCTFANEGTILGCTTVEYGGCTP